MVNAVFLVALCFTIFVEAIQRMFEPEPITNEQLLLGVGCGGLFINLVGLLLFHNQGEIITAVYKGVVSRNGDLLITM